jgi:hypothetical protein
VLLQSFEIMLWWLISTENYCFAYILVTLRGTNQRLVWSEPATSFRRHGYRFTDEHVFPVVKSALSAYRTGTVLHTSTSRTNSPVHSVPNAVGSRSPLSHTSYCGGKWLARLFNSRFSSLSLLERNAISFPEGGGNSFRALHCPEAGLT